MPAGRGLRAGDGAPFQLARPRPAADVVRHAVERWSGEPRRPDAVVLRPLPARVALRDLPQGPQVRLGLAGDTASPLTVDVFAGSGRWLVAGPPRSGRSTALATLLGEARRVGLAVLVAAPRRSPLDALARAATIRVIGPDDEDVGDAPAVRTLLLVDDSDAFIDTAAGDALTVWARQSPPPGRRAGRALRRPRHHLPRARCRATAQPDRSIAATGPDRRRAVRPAARQPAQRRPSGSWAARRRTGVGSALPHRRPGARPDRDHGYGQPGSRGAAANAAMTPSGRQAMCG